MKAYKSMSDFNINKRVAEIRSLATDHETGISKYKDSPYGYMITRKESLIHYPFDPVNNISQAWPIMLENKISIEFRHHKSLDPIAKRFGSDSHNITDPNPLRAAMIVYLMMSEE